MYSYVFCVTCTLTVVLHADFIEIYCVTGLYRYNCTVFTKVSIKHLCGRMNPVIICILSTPIIIRIYIRYSGKCSFTPTRLSVPL